MLSLTTLFASILLGSMVFFSGIVAPSIFRSMDDEKALIYTRYLFPKYYLWCIAVSALALLFSLIGKSYLAIPLSIILLGFGYGRQILLPKISAAKDQWLSSESPQDKAKYKSLHKRSVIINGFQMIFLLFIVVANQVLYPPQL
jgi:hypothetical protein